MISHGVATLFGVEAQAIFDAVGVAAALEAANSASPVFLCDAIAVDEGLSQSDPAAAAAFKENLLALLQGDRRVESPKKEMAAIVGNSSRKKWGQVARFATHPDTPMTLCECFINRMQDLVGQTVAEVLQLPQNDIEGLTRIHDGYISLLKQLEKIRPLLMANISKENAAWAVALLSSASQCGSTLSTTMIIQLSKLREKKAEWNWAISRILRFHTNIPMAILGPYGFRVPHAKREIAEKFLHWMTKNFPQRFWSDRGIKFVNTTGLVWEGKSFLKPKWPLTADDPAVKRYLDLLGWTMTVQTMGTTTVVKLDFGESALVVPNHRGPLRNAKGGFELDALTPEEVESLSLADRVVLAKQLVRALYRVCAITHINLQELSENDRNGFERIDRALKEETYRLLDLFPRSGDPFFASLVTDLKSSATQLPNDILLAMAVAIRTRNFAIPSPDRFWKKIPITGPKTFRVEGTKSELVTNLLGWLRERAPEESYENDVWTLRYTQREKTKPVHFTALADHSPWPPDPEHDIVLKTYLEMLGWRMVVEGNTIHLSF